MSLIAENLKKIHHEIIDACKQFRRNPNEIKLLAVSKYQSVAKIQEAIASGQTAFGENFVQEAVPKIQQIAIPQVSWHYIGKIQSNKTRLIAENFAWAHSVTNLKTATRLAAQRPLSLPPLNICIAVNIDAEPTKDGVSPEALAPLTQAIVGLPRLRLRGLMIIPRAQDTFDQQRRSFAQCRELRHQINQKFGLSLDTLSMGMSNDFSAAIAEGATILRIGSAIFGSRRRDVL